MSTTANYASTPRAGMVVVSTANSALDGTGTLGTVFTAGASGSRIDAIQIYAIGTTTAGMVRLFLSDGVNNRLFAEIPVLALTPSATQPAFSANLQSNASGLVNTVPLPFSFGSGYSLKASTQNAESFVVIGFGGDF